MIRILAFGHRTVGKSKWRRFFGVLDDAIKITLPALSPTMEVGKIASWKKKEGESFVAGEVLATIETDKAVVDFEMQDDGVLAKILVPSGGDELKVGSILAYAVENSKDVAAVAQALINEPLSSAKANQTSSSPSPMSIFAQQPSTSTHHSQNKFLMPSASVIVHHENIDPSSIIGSGKDGRITKGDVLSAIKNGSVRKIIPKVQASPVSTNHVHRQGAANNNAKTNLNPTLPLVREGGIFKDNKPSTMRKVIASRLTDSKANVPHYYTTMECEIDSLLKFRKNLKSEHGISISVNDLVIRAAGCALRDVPEANAQLDGNNEIVENKGVDISVAVATEGGLITPIIKNVEQKGLMAIGEQVKEMVGRAKLGKLKPEEFQGGSFTISNLGMFGIKEFTAVINPPQSCILAVGGGIAKIVPKFDKSVNKLIPKKITSLSVCLSSDRRVVPDFIAGQFLQTFRLYIENPSLLSV